jgi:hypothetical protein
VDCGLFVVWAGMGRVARRVGVRGSGVGRMAMGTGVALLILWNRSCSRHVMYTRTDTG